MTLSPIVSSFNQRPPSSVSLQRGLPGQGLARRFMAGTSTSSTGRSSTRTRKKSARAREGGTGDEREAEGEGERIVLSPLVDSELEGESGGEFFLFRTQKL